MTAINLLTIERHYKNNGQHAQQVADFTLTGKIHHADNRPFWAGGDVGDIQIKSSRATVCMGTDIHAHIAKDGANRYGYVTADFSIMYIMDAVQYIEFVSKFATVDRESNKNGGREKLRLKKENRAMIEWLQAMA